jgi:aminoglycoside phosphotransferase (APT) family kinase protein
VDRDVSGVDLGDLGEPIARGRSADIFDLGDGRVLRRRRTGPIPDAEVAAMRWAMSGGYPVPTVHAVAGSDMVLDRIEGDDMLARLASRPWQAAKLGRLLAGLHLRLRDVPIADGLPSIEPVEVLVHNDLHPGNVLMTAEGPVVIDWEGAMLGPADFDVATAWMLMVVAVPDDLQWYLRPIVGLVRRSLARSFLRRAGRPSSATVQLVCERRLADPNMRPSERENIAAFARRHGSPTDAINGRDPGGDAAIAP